MINRLSNPGGRRYALGAYTAVALLLLYILYALDRSGLSIHVNYDASNGVKSVGSGVKSPVNLPAFQLENKVAVIIETRDLSSLTPLLAHFSSVLGPSWPIVLYTSPTAAVPRSAPFKRLIDARQLQVRFLPSTVVFKTRQDVSDFLTESWLYDQLAPAEHMLFFQSDSMLCARSEATVDDFLEFDFIGAPIDEKYGHGFNGGLSMRNRKVMLDIINTFRGEQEKNRNTTASVGFEDQWFYKQLLGRTDAKIPTMEEASRFAVETVWYDTPLGFHQVSRWQKDKLKEVDVWCPEHRLVVGEQIPD